MKTALVLLLTVALANFASARAIVTLAFQQMYDQADLIVIARPVSVKDTTERTALPSIGHSITAADLALPEAERGKVMVLGVETEFTVETLVKGDKTNGNHFVLHHYKSATPNRHSANGPMLVSFDPANQQAWLLFLKKETGDRFAPVVGQTDPGYAGIAPADQIDLVAIAKPVSAKARADDITIPNTSPGARATGYETQFSVQKVLRGDRTTTNFVFHHYERADMWLARRSFDPLPGRSYLLFLQRETDGHFKTGPTGSMGLQSPAPDLAIVKLPDY